MDPAGLDPIAFARPAMGEEEARAAAEVVRSGWIVGGPQLAAFEQEFADRCGAPHGVGVSSWTTGAFLLLKCLGIGPGDEVVVPSYTFIATVNAIRHTGATPVFADIQPGTCNIDPQDVRRRITPRTRAILPVDQLGMPCDMDAIVGLAARADLLVIDDAACAVGSRNRGRPVGGLCHHSVFSLHARKLVTCGEGGMILTDDVELAARLRRQRHQGMSLSDFERHGLSPTTFESYPEVGYNFRITDIQAAIGRVQLARLDSLLAERTRVARRYLEAMGSHPLVLPPVVPEGMTPNWQSFQVMVRDDAPLSRNEIMERLHERGIPSRRSVMAVHLEPPYEGQGQDLPVTEHAMEHGLQLPMHSGLTDDQVDRVLEALDG